RPAVPLAHSLAHLSLVQTLTGYRSPTVLGQIAGSGRRNRPPGATGRRTGQGGGTALLLRRAVRPACACALHEQATVGAAEGATRRWGSGVAPHAPASARLAGVN